MCGERDESSLYLRPFECLFSCKGHASAVAAAAPPWRPWLQFGPSRCSRRRFAQSAADSFWERTSLVNSSFPQFLGERRVLSVDGIGRTVVRAKRGCGYKGLSYCWCMDGCLNAGESDWILLRIIIYLHFALIWKCTVNRGALGHFWTPKCCVSL